MMVMKSRTTYNAKHTLGAKVPPTVKGAIGELAVCTDLLAQGYEVFRSISPTCSCDLVMLKDRILKRVEVRLGGRHKYNQDVIYYRKTAFRADIMAVVLPKKDAIHEMDYEILYFPPLTEVYGSNGSS